MMRLAIGLAVISMAAACSGSSNFLQGDGEWIDLTHDFDDTTLYWPTAERFKLTTVADGETDVGYRYSAYSFETSEHGGTHLDAPVHFYADGESTEQIPLDSLIGPAIVIDVQSETAANSDYGISVQDILEWEERYGRIIGRPIVLFNTGWAARWPDADAYLGTDKRGARGVDELSFPGLTPEAADLLANDRDIRAIGLDTPSLDMAQSTDFMAHRILFEKNIPGFENIASLNLLPSRGAHIVALPMNIQGGSGGPLRIVAFIPN